MTFDARLRAYAKVNLGLRVLYKRPDGYHELRTVFQTTSLADEITLYVTPSRATKVEVVGASEIPDNLAVRAANLILESLKIHADIRITLKKNIPMGAGLGGGSADAAATSGTATTGGIDTCTSGSLSASVGTTASASPVGSSARSVSV